MKISDLDRADFSRCARDLYAHGDNEDGHLLSAVAAKTDVPEEQYERAHKRYCSWLKVRALEVKCRRAHSTIRIHLAMCIRHWKEMENYSNSQVEIARAMSSMCTMMCVAQDAGAITDRTMNVLYNKLIREK